ncbi:MAG TPA: FMN-binding protein [Acidimicrobiales bacterium]|nr:FMN-binding protein [Acidimicrobiales bacterium]
MKRTGLVLSGALVGLVGLLGYRAATPSLPAFVVSPSTSSGSSTTAPPATTTTTAAPPPQNSTTTTSPPRTSTTTHVPTTTAPPTTTTLAPPTTTTTTAPSATRSATGESVNYIYGVLSVEVTASGSKISKVKIGSINDGGNYRSESIDQMAIPQLEQETLSVQSANIQAVSGASYTSAGFRQSLQSALSKLGL